MPDDHRMVLPLGQVGRRDDKGAQALVYVIRRSTDRSFDRARLAKGGEGYSSPLERDPQRVLQAVINGYVSVACARNEYGVVIHESEMEIDWEATQKQREQMRASQGG